MKAHNATYVPYKNGQVDFDHFAVFTVDVKVSSKRSVTHPNTNKEIARTIVEHNGDYSKMFSNNVMGIASGSQRSQDIDIAKNIIESANKYASSSILSEDEKIEYVNKLLKGKQKEFGQAIHEENLVKGKQKNKTQWVDTDVNHQFGHLGGTSEAKRQELEKVNVKVSKRRYVVWQKKHLMMNFMVRSFIKRIFGK